MRRPTFTRLLALSILLAPAAALAQSGQGVPQPTDAPTVSNSPTIIRPVPDTHGRADQGERQLHGSDTASPGATGTSTPAGSAGTGGAMGNSAGSGQQPIPPQPAPGQ